MSAGLRSETTRSGLPSTIELAAVDLDGAGVAAEHGVVAEQVTERLRVGQVVDGDDVDVLTALTKCSEEVAADAAEAVDPDADGHLESSHGADARWK